MVLGLKTCGLRLRGTYSGRGARTRPTSALVPTSPKGHGPTAMGIEELQPRLSPLRQGHDSTPGATDGLVPLMGLCH